LKAASASETSQEAWVMVTMQFSQNVCTVAGSFKEYVKYDSMDL